MIQKHRKGIIKSAAGVLMLLLSIFVLLSCDQNIIPASRTEESPETTQTEEQTTPEKESSTEAPTEETAPVVIEPGDTGAAYRRYLQVLQGGCAEIDAWNPEKEEGSSGEGKPANVALCDITGDDAPELLYLSSEIEDGEAGQTALLRILSLSGGTEQEIAGWKDLGLSDESRYYCFFTVSGSRMLYAYAGSEDENRTDSWYYFETQQDGSLMRRELAVSRAENLSGEAEYYYMGEYCSEEKYRSLTDLLLYGADSLLLSNPDDVFSQRFPETPVSAANYGMSAEQAISFLRSELAQTSLDNDDFEAALWDWLMTERYLVSGAKYDTGEGSAELQFGLHDMDADGTPELFISNGSPLYAELTDHIYRYGDGAFSYIGDAGFRECLLWTAPGSAYPGVFCTGGHSGFITDVYYGIQEDGTVSSEIIATYEDTSYKVHTHDAEKVTNDQALYDTWLAMQPAEGRETVYVQMHPMSWIRENGTEAFLREAQPAS